MPTRTRLGAIDAGANAIRVVIAELSGTELVRIEAERIPVRLGHNAFTQGTLEDATIAAAVAACIHFRELFDQHQVSIYRAITTSAVRNASNRDVLLHRLYHEAGIELEVIEGEEEARLVRKSEMQAFGANQPPRALLDLGGGNAEALAKSFGDSKDQMPGCDLGELEKGLPALAGATGEERIGKFGIKRDRAE